MSAPVDPHEYDPFGMSRAGVRLGRAIAHPMYARWFRVQAYGRDHLPARGAAIVVANHAGTLPFDAAMLWRDLLEVPREAPPRFVVDHFVPNLPFVGTFFARTGAVVGNRPTFHRLLSNGELVVVFPEGTAGIGKPFRERYHIAQWRVGHAELAIRHGVPVIPAAIIGSEEQMPAIAKLPLRVFGAPYLPLPVTPLPLPVHYAIHYGAPISFASRFRPEEGDDPRAVDAAANETRAAVERLIADGLRQRRGIFR